MNLHRDCLLAIYTLERAGIAQDETLVALYNEHARRGGRIIKDALVSKVARAAQDKMAETAFGADEPETTLDVATRIYEEQAAKAVEAEAVPSEEDKAKVTEVEVAKADEVDETKGTKGSEATEVVAEEVKVDAEADDVDEDQG